MKKFIKIGNIRIVLEFERGYAINRMTFCVFVLNDKFRAWRKALRRRNAGKGGSLECPNT